MGSSVVVGAFLDAFFERTTANTGQLAILLFTWATLSK